MVAGARVVVIDLFLRALCFCEHHRACNRDVYPFSDRDSGRGSSDLPGGAFAGLLFKPRCIADSLWHDARAHLFRRGLHIATHLVDTWTDYIGYNDYHLECGGVFVVGRFLNLVTPWLDISRHLL